MFDSLRDKFSRVQDGITSSFRGLSVGEPVPSKSDMPDIYAGAHHLAKYQIQWEELHKHTETNIHLAQKVDSNVHTLHSFVNNRKRMISSFDTELSGLNKLVASTESVVNQIGELRCFIQVIEKDLIMLEDVVEEWELSKKKRKIQKNLLEHEKNKYTELGLVKDALTSIHLEKLREKESFLAQEKQAKHELYDKKFKCDIQVFKNTGVIPAREEVNIHEDLDEIVLEESRDDLEKLLEDVQCSDVINLNNE